MKNKIKKLFDNNTTHGKIMRLILVIIVFAIVCLLGYFILKVTGLLQKVNSVDKIRDIVERGGVFSFVIFLLFQILQTTVLQIPAIFVTIAGAVIFGRWPAFILSYIGVMIGSIIMFWIGRKAGKKFLNWLVGKDSAKTWEKKMSNGKYLYFLMMIFPMFPDDILCVVAGLTNMSFTFFFWTNVLARALGVGCTVFLGSGEIIPYHGWGLIVWAVLIVLIGVLFFLSVKFKDKIDNLFAHFGSKMDKRSEKFRQKIKSRKNKKNENKQTEQNVNVENDNNAVDILIKSSEENKQTEGGEQTINSTENKK